MVHTAINLFDLIVFAIIGLSAIMSFFRGFVREVLSLGAWVGASIVTLYAFPHVAAMLKPHVGSEMIASGFAALFTFMGSLIIISVFNSLLLKFMKTGSDIGLADNMMGLMFGLLRGALLVAVAYFIFALTTDKDDYPEWMTGSVTLPYVEQASAWVAKIAPDYLDDITAGGKTPSEVIDDAKEKSEEMHDQVDDAEPSTHWPDMGDLKDKMEGGGY